jgi:hypothetical protein
MDPSTLCQIVAQAFWLVLGAGLSSLGITWRLFRTTRYLKEALVREQRSSIERERRRIAESYRTFNALQRSLLESFLREPTPTLRDLVERTEREFQARASEPPSGESDSTMELRTRDFIPR